MTPSFIVRALGFTKRKGGFVVMAAAVAALGVSSWAKAYPTTFVGGSGGTPMQHTWNTGYAVGIHGRAGNEVDKFGTYNQSLNPGPAYGGNGGWPFSQVCDNGYVMLGLRGRAASRVDAVGSICVLREHVNNFEGYRDIRQMVYFGGTGGSYFSITCAAGNGMHGFYGNFGSRVDRLAAACRL